MEDLIKFYDKMVADTMAYMVVHANNRNEGRNVVYVDIEDEETLFFFHCAMNVGSAFGKIPVYVDSSFANYVRLWFKYHKQIKLKRAKRKDLSFSYIEEYDFAEANDDSGHTAWLHRDIYEEFYKGDSKW